MSILPFLTGMVSIFSLIAQNHCKAKMADLTERDIMNIYEKIYQKLERIGIMKVTGSIHLKSTGFMDLVIEKLGNNHYSLTHYYELNGDLVPDPDIEVQIMPEQKMAEALSYQDSFGYRRVYDGNKVNIKAKKDLNTFLNQWLSNLIDQGFKN